MPIAHMVPRDPDFSGKGDACLDGAGGYSEDLHFWWYFDWPKEVKKKTLKYYKKNVQVDKNNFVSINLLEYVTIIVMYAAATETVREKESTLIHKYPIFKNESDNKSAVAWTRKAAMSGPIGKALARLFCMINKDNMLGLESAYLRGEDNEVADNISRMNSEKLKLASTELIAAFPTLKNCRRFYPNQEFLSCLTCALLSGQRAEEKLPKSYGQFEADNSGG